MDGRHVMYFAGWGREVWPVSPYSKSCCNAHVMLHNPALITRKAGTVQPVAQTSRSLIPVTSIIRRTSADRMASDLE